MIDFYSTDEGRIPNYQLSAAFAENAIKHKAKLNIESRCRPKRLTKIMCTMSMTLKHFYLIHLHCLVIQVKSIGKTTHYFATCSKTE